VATDGLPTGDLVAVGVFTLLALVIRAHGIGTTNLWLDEANSWLLTTYSVHDMLANLRHSPASPLYFLLLKLWTLVWVDSTAALRSLSLIASLPLIPVAYVIGRYSIGRGGGLIAAALIALSPLQLYFAQEARVYMLATLLSAVATAAYLRWRDQLVRRLAGDVARPHPDRSLVLYTLAAVASLYTLPLVGLLYLGLALDALLVIGRAGSAGGQGDVRRVLARRWVLAHVAMAVACLPFVLALDAGAAVNSQAWRGPMGIAGAAHNFLEFFLASIHGLYFYPWDLYPAIQEAWGRAIVTRLVVVFPLTIVALVTALAYPPKRVAHGPARVLYWALLLPLLAGAVVSIKHELSLTRYLLYVSPYFFLLLGAGIVSAPRWIGIAVCAVIVSSSIYGLAQYPTVKSRDSDYRPTAALLADSTRPSDAVVVQPPEAGVQLAYYLRGKTVPLWGMSAGAAPDSALRQASGLRTWIALDYRSRWYSTPPDSLAKEIPGVVVSDRRVGSGDDRVRIVEVDNATPNPSVRGLSDSTVTCCDARATIGQRRAPEP